MYRSEKSHFVFIWVNVSQQINNMIGTQTPSDGARFEFWLLDFLPSCLLMHLERALMVSMVQPWLLQAFEEEINEWKICSLSPFPAPFKWTNLNHFFFSTKFPQIHLISFNFLYCSQLWDLDLTMFGKIFPNWTSFYHFLHFDFFSLSRISFIRWLRQLDSVTHIEAQNESLHPGFGLIQRICFGHLG